MTKDHETDTDDLVERLENSKGWPNLGKAAAARILADAEVIKAAEELAEAVTREREMPCQDMDMQLREIQAVDDALNSFLQALQVRAVTKDHQPPAERRIADTECARITDDALVRRLFKRKASWVGAGVAPDEICQVAATRILAYAEVIKKAQAALAHQTERLRIAIERAEKAEAQREADAEVIKAAEALAEALDKYARSGTASLICWDDVIDARRAFWRAPPAPRKEVSDERFD